MCSRWFTRYASTALAVGMFVTLPALADPGKLAAGDVVPPIEADSVAGTRAALPGDHRGAAFVAIFSFSQKAGEASARWSHALYKALPPDVAIYAVADLSRVPGTLESEAVASELPLAPDAASIDELDDLLHALRVTSDATEAQK